MLSESIGLTLSKCEHKVSKNFLNHLKELSSQAKFGICNELVTTDAFDKFWSMNLT